MKHKKREPKKIVISNKGLQPVQMRDILWKNLPPAKITLVNSFGEILLDSIQIDMRHSGDWRNLRFFYERLLPLTIPNLDTKKEPTEEKKHQYVG